jgi:hypothetical protein
VSSGLKFIALVDGQTVPGIGFDVYRRGSDEPVQKVKSDGTGWVEVRFTQADLYVLSAEAPQESVRDGRIVNTPDIRCWWKNANRACGWCAPPA